MTAEKLSERVERVVELLNQEDPVQTVRITATETHAPLPVTVSKFGGVPYLPEGVDAPTSEAGQPLGMIA